MLNLPPSTPRMQASKWLTCPILIDDQEMSSLCNTLGAFHIYLTSGVLTEGEGEVSHEAFLECYKTYVNALQKGQLPEESHYRQLFSAVFSTSSEALYSVDVGNQQHLIRLSKPVIQLQAHRIDYSSADGKFRSMAFGSDTIPWGIQFSYPQLYMDQNTQQAMQVDASETFPNTQLFRTLQRWVRANTIPTPLIVHDKEINIPMRLGKQCLSWINNHPQLVKKGIKVKV